jgi:hypothetical protein
MRHIATLARRINTCHYKLLASVATFKRIDATCFKFDTQQITSGPKAWEIGSTCIA